MPEHTSHRSPAVIVILAIVATITILSALIVTGIIPIDVIETRDGVNNTSNTETNQQLESDFSVIVQDSNKHSVRRFIDPEAEVVCWNTDFGVGCVPLNETNLTKGDIRGEKYG